MSARSPLVVVAAAVVLLWVVIGVSVYLAVQ
jgi:hypothetical protein